MGQNLPAPKPATAAQYLASDIKNLDCGSVNLTSNPIQLLPP